MQDTLGRGERTHVVPRVRVLAFVLLYLVRAPHNTQVLDVNVLPQLSTFLPVFITIGYIACAFTIQTHKRRCSIAGIFSTVSFRFYFYLFFVPCIFFLIERFVMNYTQPLRSRWTYRELVYLLVDYYNRQLAFTKSCCCCYTFLLFQQRPEKEDKSLLSNN